MKYYKGYPIVLGALSNISNLRAKCPYCGNIEHFSYGRQCSNPTRRLSHCKEGSYDYYYIYIKPEQLEEVKQNDRKSNV